MGDIFWIVAVSFVQSVSSQLQLQLHSFSINKSKMTGVLPVENIPVTMLLLCGVCRDIVVQVNKVWEEIFYNLCSHH